MNNDLDTVVTQFQEFGIFDEDINTIESRLEGALRDVGRAQGVSEQDMGVLDWASKRLEQIKKAVYAEICDPQKKALKDDYQNLFKQGLSPAGVNAVASVVIHVVALVNPTFAVSSVAVYLAIFLLKRGLNDWCSIPRP